MISKFIKIKQLDLLVNNRLADEQATWTILQLAIIKQLDLLANDRLANEQATWTISQFIKIMHNLICW